MKLLKLAAVLCLLIALRAIADPDSLTIALDPGNPETVILCWKPDPANPASSQYFIYNDDNSGVIDETSVRKVFTVGAPPDGDGELEFISAAYGYGFTWQDTLDSPTAKRFYAVAAEALKYPVVDTGQDLCYGTVQSMTCPAAGSAFYGQDAQYNGNQPSYTDNGDGTITDDVTGLMWVKARGEKMSWADAYLGAGTCTVGGYTDWRMPAIKEIYSLILFTGSTGNTEAESIPYIDDDIFEFEYGDVAGGERLIDCQDWSSTQYVHFTMNNDSTVFGVNFADGRIKGYPKYEPQTGDPHLLFVRYCRGNPHYGINEFSNNNDGTITDAATGLMWMQADNGTALLWEDALEYAETLDFTGHDDWRLPNAKELQSIVDYTRSPATTNSPALDPIFSATQLSDDDYPWYWSGTTHIENAVGNKAAYVCFGRATGWMQAPFPPYDWVLMDVHGAGAQRSDFKTGDPDDYPHGHGPQGDVIRIYNYVRCVRDLD